MSRRGDSGPLMALMVGLVGLASLQAEAGEPAERFVAKLREQGHYEMAVYYLEKMRDSALVDPAFQETIDYEAGLTLLSAARTGEVMAVRRKQLDRAGQYLQRFVENHPNHEKTFSARAQLANLLVERARIQREQASGAEDEQRRATFARRARELLDEAESVFKEQRALAIEKHEQYGSYIDPGKTKRIEERSRVRQNILEARLALAGIIHERALTYPPDSEPYNQQLQASADAYQELYEDYAQRMAGLYARMWEGRCYKEMGEYQQALELFEQLLTQPDDAEPIRKLQSKALVLYLESCLAAEEYGKGHKAIVAWRKNVRGAEETSAEGLAIQYFGGAAAMHYAEELDPAKPDEAKQQKAALAEARKSLKLVAKFRNEFQKKARQALAELGVAQAEELADFAGARDRGKDALDRLRAEGLTAAERGETMAEAMRYFRTALTMAEEETEPADVNIVRYYMAYLYWLQGDYYQAALIGEFLAGRYPAGVASRQAAKIAMASYAKMLGSGSAEGKQFEIGRMVEMATRITELWPEAPEAGDAWMTLVRHAVKDEEYDRAQRYIENMPESSPKRGEAELMIGRSLWSEYVAAARREEGDRPRQDQLDAMVDRAKQVLESGVTRMKQAADAGGQVSYPLLASALSLVQIYVNQRETDEALGLLEDPEVGPLTLVNAEHPAAERETFRIETYKAALRVYVGTQELDKAEQIMQQLEDAATSGGEEAQSRLTRIYISLGRDLEEQLELLRKQHKKAEQREVARGFEMFLARISQRPGNTFNSLNWVAETFLGMAEGLNPGGEGDLPPQARQYYKRAVQAYQQIRKEIRSDPDFAPQGAAASIQIRMARALRQLGKHVLAQKLLLLVLRDRPMMLDGQIECAYTYQARGTEKPAWYKLAILGSRKHEQFWGWGRLGNRVANHEQYRDTFHEARYNLALCRMKYALSKNGDAKNEWLGKAEKDILVVARLFPQLGGDTWRPQYDDLLRDIQGLLGKRAVGLDIIEEKQQAKKTARAD